MEIKKYEISFFAKDQIRQDEDKLVCKKVVFVPTKNLVDMIARGYIYEWLFEDSSELSPFLHKKHCKISWKVKKV